jgi:hypothetical protein
VGEKIIMLKILRTFIISILLFTIIPVFAHDNSKQRANSNESIRLTILKFTKTWLQSNSLNDLRVYISANPLLGSEGISKENKNKMNEREKQNLILNSLLGSKKDFNNENTPEKIFEPLDVVNPDPHIIVDLQLKWGMVLKVNAEQASGFLSSVEDMKYIKEKYKGLQIYSLIFKVKGKPDGITPPFVLLWVHEKAAWRLLAVGSLKQ